MRKFDSGHVDLKEHSIQVETGRSKLTGYKWAMVRFGICMNWMFAAELCEEDLSALIELLQEVEKALKGK